MQTVTTYTEINRLELSALFMAEITRFKFGNKASLSNPKLERAARHRFAAIAGIKPNSPASIYLQAIREVYKDNGLLAEFNARIEKFKLSPDYFAAPIMFIENYNVEK